MDFHLFSFGFGAKLNGGKGPGAYPFLLKIVVKINENAFFWVLLGPKPQVFEQPAHRVTTTRPRHPNNNSRRPKNPPKESEQRPRDTRTTSLGMVSAFVLRLWEQLGLWRLARMSDVKSSDVS